MKYPTRDRQSIFDIAIQKRGGVEAAFALALENNLSLTEDLTVGQAVAVCGENNKTVSDFYTKKQLLPATGITGTWLDNISGNENGKRIFDYTHDLTFE
jgi:hypothetical protein